MVVRRGHSDAAVKAALTSPMNDSVLSAITAPLVGWPDGIVGPFVATIGKGLVNEERILCSGSTGGTTTITTRGYAGTTRQSHSAGEYLEHTFSGIEADEANAHIVAVTGVHGLAGGDRPVGRSSTDALSNKSIDGGNNTLTNIPLSAIPDQIAKNAALDATDAAASTALGNRYTKAETDAAVGAEAATRSSNDAAEAAARTAAIAAAAALLLPLLGGTLTGDLVLHGDPTSALMAATKQYVDAQVTAAKLPGAWTAFNPVLHGSSSGGLFGNAVNNGSVYRLETNVSGKVLDVLLDFTTGTTTSFGTGALLIDLPGGLAALGATPAHVGDGLLLAIAGGRKGVMVEMNSTTQFAMVNADDGVAVSGSTPSPFSFGIGSTIRARLRLPIA